MRSPSQIFSLIASCTRTRRATAASAAPIAQIRRAPRRHANLPSGLPLEPVEISSADLLSCRSGGQQLFDPLRGGRLVDPFNRSELANEPVEGCLVNLTLAI